MLDFERVENPTTVTPEDQITDLIAALVGQVNGAAYAGRMAEISALTLELWVTWHKYQDGELETEWGEGIPF